MKKAVSILLVFLFFVFLIIAILFKLIKPNKEATTYVPTRFPVATAPVGAESEDPAQFVSSFYTWYLLNFSKDPLFPYPENRNEVLGPWLTNDFLVSWDEIVSELEVNPVLLTAEDPSTWGTNISARVSSESVRTKVVYMIIGSGGDLHAFNVDLVQISDGSWKINSAASAI